MASSGDVIVVGPGTYSESVSITIPGLSLFGAQVGKDARADRHDSSKESIVDGSGTGNPTITVDAINVVVDGFTVQGGTAATSPAFPAGIFVQGTGAQVRNDIIKNNSMGVSVSDRAGVIIERNLIKNNNTGAEPYVGYGIFAMIGPFLNVVDNEFTGNMAALIYVYFSTGATIANNTSDKDGSFVVWSNTEGGAIKHNQGRNFGANGVKPVFIPPSGPTIAADAAIDIGRSSLYLEISDDDLEGGGSTTGNGIAFTTVLGLPSGSSSVTVKDNKIKRFPGNGIVVEESGGTGTLQFASISGNEVEDNGADGILIENSTDNSGNVLWDNEAEGNPTNDCEDDSGMTTPGTGTAGTHNTWFNNIGTTSSPNRLCSPGRSHDHDQR